MGLIDDHVASVRQGYERLTAHEALAARQDGALVVDTRTERQQRHFGRIAGAIEIDRTVTLPGARPAPAGATTVGA